jgi:Na+/citrate or Na+/malate symporter
MLVLTRPLALLGGSRARNLVSMLRGLLLAVVGAFVGAVFGLLAAALITILFSIPIQAGGRGDFTALGSFDSEP